MSNRFAACCLMAVLIALLAFPARATPHATPTIRIVLSGPPLLSGRLDKLLIRRVIKAHRNELRACYEAGLLRQPALHGRVELQFLIDPSGRVTVLRISGPSSFEQSPVDVLPCIATAVMAWQFPAVHTIQNAVAEVRYPIEFRTSEPVPASPPGPLVNPYFSDEELAAMSNPRRD